MHAANFAFEQNKKVFCPIPNAENICETQEGLLYLLNNKDAIGIPSGSRFEIPIFELGYKIKHNKERLNKIKNNNIKKMLQINPNTINFTKLIEENYFKENQKRITISVDITEYENLKKLINKKHLSNKEFFNCLIKALNITQNNQ